MSQPKATLEEMATACQDEAENLFVALRMSEKQFPDLPPNTTIYRRIFVFESAANLLRIMGTFPDQSRPFVGKLIEEHGRG